MVVTSNLLEGAQRILDRDGVLSRKKISKELGINEQASRIIREVIVSKTEILNFYNHGKGKSNNSVEKETTDNTQTIVTRSHEIRTLEELLDFCKVDLEEWEVSKHVVNSWGAENNENFQVKAWLKKREEVINILDILKRFEEKAKELAPKYKPIVHKHKSGNMLEIATHDFHFGQLSWGSETGGPDYDIKIAKKIYVDSVQYFLEHGKLYKPDRIVFLVGSDWYNSNNFENMTQRGTRQDEDSRWKKTFTEGWELIVDSVDICRKVADVDVVVIPGNHDGERSYYMGEVLKSWYRNCNNVTVDNGPKTRKYYRYGKNLLGYTHGDKEKIDELPLIMAQEASEHWGDTEHREFKTGHLHHKKKYIFMPLQEHQSIRVVQCPTLAALDAWHSEKGYHSIREANGNIWNKENGNIANFNYHPKKDLTI